MEDGLEERGLPRSVLTDDTYAVPSAERDLGDIEQRLAPADERLLEIRDLVRRTLGEIPEEIRTERRDWRRQELDFLKRPLAALRESRA